MTEAGGPSAAAGDRRSGIEEELSLSRLQQRSIVSLVAPDVPGYDIASHYEAAREIGGDFFDLFRLRRRGHPLGIVIADVDRQGHRRGPADGVRPADHPRRDDRPSGPADALERTNRILVDEIHSSLFITALVGRLEPASGQVRLANAGHEPPLIVRADGRTDPGDRGGGPLVGAFSPLDVPETTIELAPGDRAAPVHRRGDRLPQAPSRERFGEPRLLETIEAARGGSAQELVARASATRSAFRATSRPVDDITIVAIGRHARG